jgi:Skp family chaperone for outer membrane proteins
MLAVTISTVALLRPQADASATMRAPASPVATVDLVSVITQLDEFKAIDAKIKAEGAKKTAEIEQLSEEIEGLQEDLKRLDPNSDAYDDTFRELNMKAGFRELRGTMLIRWQSEDNARVLTELYEKALKAVEAVAKRDGWEIVIHRGQSLTVPRNPNVRAENAMDFVENFIQTRRVIYSGESVDISSSVVQHMNNQFAAGK